MGEQSNDCGFSQWRAFRRPELRPTVAVNGQATKYGSLVPFPALYLFALLLKMTSPPIHSLFP